MNLPPFPPTTDDILYAIIAIHELPVTEYTLLPQIGLFNKIYQLGDDYILRIARNHPKSFAVSYTESIAVPFARAAGMRTPSLLVYDDSCQLLPVPYTIYERVPGETLGLLNLEPHETPEAWCAERPLPFLLDLMRFLLETEDERWGSLIVV